MRLTKSTACVLAFAAAVGAVALGPAGCGTSLQSIYIPASRFSASYAEALCSSLQHCCDENAIRFDYNACTAGWKALVQKRFDDPNAAALANYDAKAATDCVAQVRSAKNNSCAPEPGTISAARDTCQTIFAGKKLTGQACTTSAECAPQEGMIVRCSAAAGPDAGGQLPLSQPMAEPVCLAVPIPAAGAPCSNNPPQGCDGGKNLFCDPGTLTCLPQADVGGPCSPKIPDSCLPGNYCIASGANAALCAPALAPGSACTSAVQCDVASTCDLGGTKTCIPKGAPRASCQSGADCTSGACDPVTKTCLKNVIATTSACTGAGP